MVTENRNWKSSIDKLVQGNRRFTSGLRSADAMLGHNKLKDLAENGQKPFAIIVGCSDSRVPSELLFDCGFGELFVIRVAGNVVQPSQIASIEFAAKVLGAELCLVMGHSNCGAVQAALDVEKGNTHNLGPNIDFLIELIRPAVQSVLKTPLSSKNKELDLCIKKNTENTAKKILEKSSLLRELESNGHFKVVNAVFDLHSGVVEFEEMMTPEMDVSRAV